LRAQGAQGPGTVATAQIPLKEGVKLRVSAANTPGGAHAEINLADKLRRRGISTESVEAFYADYSFCFRCEAFVSNTFTRAKFFFNTPYTPSMRDMRLYNYLQNPRRQALRSRISDFLSLTD